MTSKWPLLYPMGLGQLLESLWSKGTNVLLPCTEPIWLQWVSSELGQLLSWCRTEETHIGRCIEYGRSPPFGSYPPHRPPSSAQFHTFKTPRTVVALATGPPSLRLSTDCCWLLCPCHVQPTSIGVPYDTFATAVAGIPYWSLAVTQYRIGA